ncbi:unnamed protein product [Ranitomeya imitator]|uniref:Transposase n=1 Tax=Ranitomeya imitator TaxID=111125 RepID=A0ABN9LZ45_9NEOB|nr:unnamed protein product [Ranitomeya imitator]
MDNDPKHASTVDYLKRHKLKVLQWPSQPPDLNIIENLWLDLKIAVHARQPRNLTELGEFSKEELMKIPQTRVERLLSGHNKRFQASTKWNKIPHILDECQPPIGSSIHPRSVSPNEWLGEKDFTKMKATSDQEENELVILHLRQLCESKQKTHVHIGEMQTSLSSSSIPENSAPSGRFKLDILKNKAKKSLTSSLENIFSRGANRMRGRLGSMDSFDRYNSFASDKDGSPGDSPPATPPSSPVSSSWQSFPEEDPDSPQFRRRAHTFSHPTSSAKKRITFPDAKSPNSKSPLQRQHSVACDGGHSSPVPIVRRVRTESEPSSSSLPSSFSTPSFLKNLYQGSGRRPSHCENDVLKRLSAEMEREMYNLSKQLDVEEVTNMLLDDRDLTLNEDLGEESEIDSHDEVEECVLDSETEQDGDSGEDEEVGSYYIGKDKNTKWNKKPFQKKT